jgi:transketolase
MTEAVVEKKAVRIAFGEALVELGRERSDFVVFDADLAHADMTCLFGDAFPDRFFNMGIAEQNMAGVAAGFAISGMPVVMSGFSMFGAGRAYEQVRNSIAYPHLNVTLAMSHNGLQVAEDGASHQSIEDIALMRVVPGMTVVVPSDANEVRKAIRLAIDIDGPVYVRLQRLPTPVLSTPAAPFEIGKAITLREGGDVAIVAAGIMVPFCLEAADLLAEAGIQATVINMHTIKPIDRAAVIAAARAIGCVVTAEEHSVIGGLGSAVAEVLSESCPTPLKRIGIEDRFGQSGAPDALFEHYGLTPRRVADQVEAFLKEAKS